MAKAPPRARPIARQNISSEIVVGPKSRARVTKGQDDLFADPMPERIEPCLALASATPPSGSNWAYEVKWDGYRLAIHVGPDRKVRVLTKGGFDWTDRFPNLAKAAAALKVENCILDGEAVVLDEQGRSDFQALQAAVPRSGRGGGQLIHFYAFDLMYLDGRDYRPKPLAERRRALASIIPRKPSPILFSEHVIADGSVFFRLACEMELEGVIAKKLNAPYRSGRGGEWLKIKCVQSETFVVVGYRSSRRSIGGIAKLFLAAKRRGQLVYVGSVGTGFSNRNVDGLLSHLSSIERTLPPVATADAEKARWVEPVTAAEIEFRGWTTHKNLRHASYKGLRGDCETVEIFEMPE